MSDLGDSIRDSVAHIPTPPSILDARAKEADDAAFWERINKDKMRRQADEILRELSAAARKPALTAIDQIQRDLNLAIGDYEELHGADGFSEATGQGIDEISGAVHREEDPARQSELLSYARKLRHNFHVQANEPEVPLMPDTDPEAVDGEPVDERFTANDEVILRYNNYRRAGSEER